MNLAALSILTSKRKRASKKCYLFCDLLDRSSSNSSCCCWRVLILSMCTSVGRRNFPVFWDIFSKATCLFAIWSEIKVADLVCLGLKRKRQNLKQGQVVKSEVRTNNRPTVGSRTLQQQLEHLEPISWLLIVSNKNCLELIAIAIANKLPIKIKYNNKIIVAVFVWSN